MHSDEGVEANNALNSRRNGQRAYRTSESTRFNASTGGKVLDDTEVTSLESNEGNERSAIDKLVTSKAAVKFTK